MKTMQLLAFAPALVYNFRFLNFFLNPGFLNPGDGTSYNGGDIENEEVLEDENLEDEELPEEAPTPPEDDFSYVADDTKTPPEREESNFEANDIDEK
jgi:hypothetical protein